MAQVVLCTAIPQQLKHIPLVAALLSFAISSECKNLVPNSSFEMTKFCPNESSEFDRNVHSWYTPNRATPDLYSTCSKSIRTNALKNVFAKTTPISGGNYAGIIVYQAGVKNYREYLSVNLDTCLAPGKEYIFTMFVRISENQPYALDHLQVQLLDCYKFQKDAYVYSRSSGTIFDVKLPNIDSAQWNEVSFSFTAIGTERILMIGCFEKDSELQVMSNMAYGKAIGEKPVYAYYLIDSVSLLLKTQVSEGVRDQKYRSQDDKTRKQSVVKPCDAPCRKYTKRLAEHCKVFEKASRLRARSHFWKRNRIVIPCMRTRSDDAPV